MTSVRVLHTDESMLAGIVDRLSSRSALLLGRFARSARGRVLASHCTLNAFDDKKKLHVIGSLKKEQLLQLLLKKDQLLQLPHNNPNRCMFHI